eukprot:351951-Chlamydomonas_euryale.AAC.2
MGKVGGVHLNPFSSTHFYDGTSCCDRGGANACTPCCDGTPCHDGADEVLPMRAHPACMKGAHDYMKWPQLPKASGCLPSFACTECTLSVHPARGSGWANALGRLSVWLMLPHGIDPYLCIVPYVIFCFALRARFRGTCPSNFCGTFPGEVNQHCLLASSAPQDKVELVHVQACIDSTCERGL